MRAKRPRLFRVGVACSVVALAFWVVRVAAGESVAVTVGAVVFTLAAVGLLVASRPE